MPATVQYNYSEIICRVTSRNGYHLRCGERSLEVDVLSSQVDTICGGEGKAERPPLVGARKLSTSTFEAPQLEQQRTSVSFQNEEPFD